MNNPYKNQPDYTFWSKTVANNHRTSFDPITDTKFKLSSNDKIATMGSCFAQHLSKWLKKNQLNFLNTDSELPVSARDKMLFSANYGNTYTVKQGLQLFEAALGRFNFSPKPWLDSNNQIRDPIRPNIEYGTFESANEMLARRNVLFKSVSEILRTHNCLVFTLGLTEAWRRIEDGAILPSAPGITAGEYCSKEYEFVNFSVGEVINDLHNLIQLVKEVNSSSKILLTVSPVPLAATAENRHVGLSTMSSKAILRAAADEICRSQDYVDYFPSFEIFYTPGIGGAYFENDLRHIRIAGVNHAMRLFNSHYVDRLTSVNVDIRKYEIEKLSNNYNDIFCDEDLIK